MFVFLNIFYIFILWGFDFRLQGTKLRFQRMVPVIGTSVVVYVPLLEFMYLCCGLCTSAGVYVPLLWFTYLCCGLCTSCRAKGIQGLDEE